MLKQPCLTGAPQARYRGATDANARDVSALRTTSAATTPGTRSALVCAQRTAVDVEAAEAKQPILERLAVRH